MAEAAAAVPAATEAGDVSRLRRLLLRANYLLWAVAGCFLTLPDLLHPDPAVRGMLESMLAGLWVTALLGLRYPVRMLPILLFAFVWKSLWLIDYGAPQWLAGPVTPRLQADMLSIGKGPLLLGLIIPWGHVWRLYVRQRSERWR